MNRSTRRKPSAGREATGLPGSGEGDWLNLRVEAENVATEPAARMQSGWRCWWWAVLMAWLGTGAVAQPMEGLPAGSATVTQGIRPEHLWTTAYTGLLWDDTRFVAMAPSRWEESQWLAVGSAVAAVAITVPFDDSIRRRTQNHRTAAEDRFLSRWQNLGSSYSLVVLGGFEAWGEVGGDLRARNVAMDGVAASIIASGIVAPTLKFVVGRDRPSANRGAFRFRPFTSAISFPSGHATQAFAVASVIAQNYPDGWVGTLAYGSAALVGYARIEQDAHFASDVVAGAIIGWSIGRAIVHRHEGPARANTLNWSPYAAGGGGGLVLYKSF